VFVELMPLLTGRTVLITVAKVDDKTILPTLPVSFADLNNAHWQWAARTESLAHPWCSTGGPLHV